MTGQPLMPTSRYGKVKHLLKEGKAVVVNRCPFTIKLTYESTTHTQEVTLGVDAGSKTIGLSATTRNKELYSSEVELRTDIVDLLSTRRTLRRSRRNRKTRYRKPRFLNRVRSKNKGWLAPSLENKINSHLKVIEGVHKLLPITKIIVEVASFDIQKIKNPEASGTDYQQGDMLGFWNVREYVLHRDGHVCQHCKGKSKDKILNVHHIESRKNGGNAPNNLITLCETCHNDYHKGRIELKMKRGVSFRDAAFMGIMRWAFYERIKLLYPDVSLTYRYITKHTRIKNNIPKTHCADAYCITSNVEANSTCRGSNHIADVVTKRLGFYYYQKKVRCHNRQLHKMNPKKDIRKLNQAPKYVFGYQLFDKVKYKNQEAFIFGRRSTGYFDIRKRDGTKVHAGINQKELKLLETRKSYLIERRPAISLTT